MENDRSEANSDVSRGKAADVNIKLGADPDELEAAIRTVAYYQGYRSGVFDGLSFILAFLIPLIGLFFILRGRESK
jgi:hypothetical protein